MRAVVGMVSESTACCPGGFSVWFPRGSSLPPGLVSPWLQLIQHQRNKEEKETLSV